jgi:hypothetical protein
MVKGGAKLGLSIDYLTRASRPDPRGGRYLDRIVIVGGALTTHPMNPAATITESKYAATAPVVGIYEDVQARHRDPDRERAAAEDAMLAALDWPPRHWDRSLRLSVLQGAAEAKVARETAEDDPERRAREHWEQNNRYSTALAATMARLRPT